MSSPAPPFASSRRFRVWDYGVSHGQLVLRSPGEEEGGPHLDLHFSGVEYLRLPTYLTGIRLVTAGAVELDEVAGALPAPRREGREIFVLSSEARRFVVVATELRIVETEGPRMLTAIVHAERGPLFGPRERDA